MKLTSKNIADQVRDEHDAYLLLEELRWHGNPVCPHCGHDKAYFLTPKGGTPGTGKPKAGRQAHSVSAPSLEVRQVPQAVLGTHQRALPRHEGQPSDVAHGHGPNVVSEERHLGSRNRADARRHA